MSRRSALWVGTCWAAVGFLCAAVPAMATEVAHVPIPMLQFACRTTDHQVHAVFAAARPSTSSPELVQSWTEVPNELYTETSPCSLLHPADPVGLRHATVESTRFRVSLRGTAAEGVSWRLGAYTSTVRAEHANPCQHGELAVMLTIPPERTLDFDEGAVCPDGSHLPANPPGPVDPVLPSPLKRLPGLLQSLPSGERNAPVVQAAGADAGADTTDNAVDLTVPATQGTWTLGAVDAGSSAASDLDHPLMMQLTLVVHHALNQSFSQLKFGFPSLVPESYTSVRNASAVSRYCSSAWWNTSAVSNPSVLARDGPFVPVTEDGAPLRIQSWSIADDKTTIVAHLDVSYATQCNQDVWGPVDVNATASKLAGFLFHLSVVSWTSDGPVWLTQKFSTTVQDSVDIAVNTGAMGYMDTETVRISPVSCFTAPTTGTSSTPNGVRLTMRMVVRFYSLWTRISSTEFQPDRITGILAVPSTSRGGNRSVDSIGTIQGKPENGWVFTHAQPQDCQPSGSVSFCTFVIRAETICRTDMFVGSSDTTDPLEKVTVVLFPYTRNTMNINNVPYLGSSIDRVLSTDAVRDANLTIAVTHRTTIPDETRTGVASMVKAESVALDMQSTNVSWSRRPYIIVKAVVKSGDPNFIYKVQIRPETVRMRLPTGLELGGLDQQGGVLGKTARWGAGAPVNSVPPEQHDKLTACLNGCECDAIVLNRRLLDKFIWTASTAPADNGAPTGTTAPVQTSQPTCISWSGQQCVPTHNTNAGVNSVDSERDYALSSRVESSADGEAVDPLLHPTMLVRSSDEVEFFFTVSVSIYARSPVSSTTTSSPWLCEPSAVQRSGQSAHAVSQAFHRPVHTFQRTMYGVHRPMIRPAAVEGHLDGPVEDALWRHLMQKTHDEVRADEMAPLMSTDNAVYATEVRVVYHHEPEWYASAWLAVLWILVCVAVIVCVFPEYHANFLDKSKWQ